jgi:hypothetical protein
MRFEPARRKARGLVRKLPLASRRDIAPAVAGSGGGSPAVAARHRA